VERAGPDEISFGHRAVKFENTTDGVTLTCENGLNIKGKVLIAADRIYSAIRAQMFPDKGPPIWNGVILWRAMSRHQPFFGGGAMALAGNNRLRFVAYSITELDPVAGLCDINRIAEKRFDPSERFNKEDWHRTVERSNSASLFDEWTFDRLDIPAVIAKAEQVFEYPLFDRDPAPFWTQGNISLIGDAARATYPVSSNSASQAIVDARVISAAFLKHGVASTALQAYEDQLRHRMAKANLANRGQSLDAVMQLVDDRCQGDFSKMKERVPQEELDEHAAHYKRLAGFSIADLHAMPSIIPARMAVTRRMKKSASGGHQSGT
jgi:5-methylphenazine-1-carboxylate 1-monooxygenase